MRKMGQEHYQDEFKKKIVRLHLQEGRTIISLAREYKISKASLSYWIRDFRNECQINQEAMKELDLMKENLKLRRELEESKKEIAFLKKAAAFFAKEID
jgi:transposase